MTKTSVLLALVLGSAACADGPTIEQTVVTTYFNGDGVLATSYEDEDGTIRGVLEDANGVVLASVAVDPSSSRWDWALDGDAAAMMFTSDLIEPTLAAANVADYVLWLRVRNARPGTPGDTTFSDQDPCVELSFALDLCVDLPSCEAWCSSLP